MLAFVVFNLVYQYYAKRLAGKNVTEMTYFVSGGTQNLTKSCLLLYIRYVTVSANTFYFRTVHLPRSFI